MSKIVQRCVERVFSGGSMSGYMCRSTAKHNHEGVWYCGTHYPPNVEAKRAARHAKWQKQYDEGNAKHEAARQKQAEQERRAACFDELLGALRMMRVKYGQYACPACDHADAAIAKAEGGNDE